MRDGQPSYVRTVRIIKQIRDTPIGRGDKPGGLYLELLTYWAFRDGAAAAPYAELRPATLANAATIFGRIAVDARRAGTPTTAMSASARYAQESRQGPRGTCPFHRSDPCRSGADHGGHRFPSPGTAAFRDMPKAREGREMECEDQ